MSAGQRTFVARNENDAKKRFDHTYENAPSDELTEYDDDDYDDFSVDDDAGTTSAKSHKRIRGKQQQQQQQKRRKSKAHVTLSSAIGPKLRNLQIVRSSM